MLIGRRAALKLAFDTMRNELSGALRRVHADHAVLPPAVDEILAFGGMGASREALVSSLAEAPFLLSLVALAILASRADITGIVSWTIQQNAFNISAVHILAFISIAMVLLAETGRMPVDNPTTHLELTMIHEGMVLEYSGPSLALIEWASAIKLHAMLALLIALFGPWGNSPAIASGCHPPRAEQRD